MNIKKLEKVDGIQWYKISGTDYGTKLELNDVYGITKDKILDSDGCPLTPGDNQYIAVENAING